MISVPASIDATGATDVTAALNAFVAGVPNGSTIVFPAGGKYLLGQGIQLANRSGLTFEGNGTTLSVSPSVSGENLTSLFILGHRYGGYWTGTDSNITIRNFTLVGNSTTPGVYQPGMEYQNGVQVEDSSSVLLDNLTIRSVWGDGVRIGGTSNGVVFRDSHVQSAGRNGATVSAGRNITIERVAFDKSGYVTFDVEPNYSYEVASNITFRDNTAGTWSDSFFAANYPPGSTVSDVTISGNTVTGDSLYSYVTLQRRQNIVFTNNRSMVTAAGPVLRFAHVDGLTVTGNVQPLSSGSLASISDCTGVIVQ